MMQAEDSNEDQLDRAISSLDLIVTEDGSGSDYTCCNVRTKLSEHSESTEESRSNFLYTRSDHFNRPKKTLLNFSMST